MPVGARLAGDTMYGDLSIARCVPYGVQCALLETIPPQEGRDLKLVPGSFYNALSRGEERRFYIFLRRVNLSSPIAGDGAWSENAASTSSKNIFDVP